MESKIYNTVWIAWERHRRTMELCRYLGIEPVIFESSLPRIFKHPWFVVRSILTLINKRPRVLVVQNPSILLAWLMCLMKPIVGYYLVVDAHNGGIIPDYALGKKVKFVYDFCQKRADVTIVTNRFLAQVVRANKGNPFVLPDRLPDVEPNLNNYDVKGDINILCVCTFELDEPYLEIFEAAKLLPSGIKIYVTGRYQKLNFAILDSCSDVIVFTGFLSDNDYWALMRRVDLVIDLTYREDCMVCGAYEAVSLAKPLILSSTIALREYFSKGAIFTDNKAQYIHAAIITSIGQLDKLKEESREMRDSLKEKWNEQGKKLVEILTDYEKGKKS